MAMRIGEKIKQLRKARGVSQEQLAGVIGVSFQAVSKWETGTTAPDLGLIPPLASYFRVSIDELFDYKVWENEQRVEEIARKAAKLLRDDVDAAYEVLQAGLKQFPGNETLMTVLVYALKVMPGKDQELMATCKTLIDCTANDGIRCDVLRILATAYHRNGMTELVAQTLDRIPDMYFSKLEAEAMLKAGQEGMTAAQLQLNLSGRTMVEMLEILSSHYEEQGTENSAAVCRNLRTGLRELFHSNGGHGLELPGYEWINA